MSRDSDIELEELFLDDPELFETATLMCSLSAPEAPVDPVFKSELRRKVMSEAWTRHEKRGRSWWPTFGRAPRLTWAASLVGIFLIALVAASVLLNQSGGSGAPVSSLDGQQNVAVVRPIDISFNQPMDTASTQAAIKVEPATDATYQWSNNNTRLTITPTSNGLAPNTQYQVTIGAGAKTAVGADLAGPKPITFVTGGLPSPPPTPASTPLPTPKISNEVRVGTIGGGTILQTGLWSPDSGTFYFIGTGGQLLGQGLGGQPRQLVPDGVKMFALSQNGSSLAFSRSGKLFQLDTDGSSPPLELTTADPQAIAFTTRPSAGTSSPKPAQIAPAGAVAFVQSGAIYTVSSPGQVSKLATLSDAADAQFSPAGDRVIYRTRDGNSWLYDLTSGQSTERGNVRLPIAWSPDGSRVAGWDQQGVYTATPDNKTQTRVASRASLGSGDLLVTWVGASQLLISNRTQLYSVGADGSNLVQLADAVYGLMVASPGGTNIAFARGDGLFFADYNQGGQGTSPAALLEDGSRQVAAFMDARVKGQADQANTYLDDSGRKAFQQAGGLVVTGDPKLTRAYQVTSEVTSSQPISVRYTVRLVFSSGKLEVAQSDETLTLVRDAGGKLVVHQVVAGARRQVGKGPEVVSVNVTPNQLTVLFDSDLDAKTVAGNVTVTDSSGQALKKLTIGYGNRAVKVSAAEGLAPGQSYRLSILAGLKDVSGRAIVEQYDFDFQGPGT